MKGFVTSTVQKVCVVVALFNLLALSAWSQANAVSPRVIHELKHDTSPPLHELEALASHQPTLPSQRTIPLRPTHTFPGTSAQADPALQQTSLPFVSATQGLNFEGVGQGQYGFNVQYAPPDTNGVVGATQYVQWVNTYFAIFDKATGALLSGPTPGNALWANFGGGCQNNNDGDPIVQYDKIANRWVFTQFSVSTTPYLQCVAVSTSSDATGTYNRYAFSFGNTNFPDYPKLGVWPDAYYMSFNIFANGVSFSGAEACALDRGKMLAGQAATMICKPNTLSSSIDSLLPSDMDGTIQPTTGEPAFFLDFTTNALRLWKFHVDFTTPSNSTFTGPTTLAVASFTPLCNGGSCVAQAGTTNKLDSLGDRLMYRLAWRKFADGHESMVVTHSITSGIRWYEIQNPNTSPTVFQQGTFAPDSSTRWMGSMAMDQSGDIALGYSLSSSSLHPSVFYTGRVPSDPAGSMESEASIVNGTGSQTGGLNRWGDYSAMTVDPVDDCTFWYTQEYIKTDGSFNWNTRIANFKFPSCGGGGGTPAVTLSPTSLKWGAIVLFTTSAGKAVTLTNTGTATLNISNIATSGDFHIKSKTCGSTVAVNASCKVTVTFTPTAIGTRTGALTFTDNASNSPQTVPLSGTGVSISFTPKTTNYGTVTVGNTSSKSITVSNVGTGTVTFTGFSIVGLNRADFTITGSTCGSTLSGGSNCMVTVQFKPTVTGTRKATLKVTDTGAGTASQTAALTGVGG